MLSLAYLLKRFHGNSMKGIPERMDVGRSPESFADRYRRFRIVTARGEEAQRVRGLSIGADDYVVKPFSVPELMTRVRAQKGGEGVQWNDSSGADCGRSRGGSYRGALRPFATFQFAPTVL